MVIRWKKCREKVDSKSASGAGSCLRKEVGLYREGKGDACQKTEQWERH